MHLDFVDLPAALSRFELSQRTAVVFDVIRATTTMITALANGACEIRAFAELDQARAGYLDHEGPKLLAGELHTLKPADFDLGNRPPEFTRARVEGRTLFMATTNGTRAVRACKSARRTFVATIANASAMARHLVSAGDDVVLVGSGVDGSPGGEDLDGIATVADAVVRARPDVTMDAPLRALIKSSSWLSNSFDRVERLRASPGGLNIIKAGLDADIPYIAQLDCFDLVAEATHGPLFATVRQAQVST